MKLAIRIITFILGLGCTFAAAQTLNYSYDAAGRLSAVTYPNGKTQTFLYDSAGNLLRAAVASPISGATPSFTVAGVVNAASYQAGSKSPRNSP